MCPCNDTYSEEKEEFLGMLAGVLDKNLQSNDLIINGEASRKVGRRTPWEAYLGAHSDSSVL